MNPRKHRKGNSFIFSRGCRFGEGNESDLPEMAFSKWFRLWEIATGLVEFRSENLAVKNLQSAIRREVFSAFFHQIPLAVNTELLDVPGADDRSESNVI